MYQKKKTARTKHTYPAGLTPNSCTREHETNQYSHLRENKKIWDNITYGP